MQEETIIKEEIEELVKQSLDNQKKLVLYNDDVNSFEHVIECLTKYAKHTPNQAEQCSLIVHYKGACDIKNGSFDDLLPIYSALLDNKLNVKIE